MENKGKGRDLYMHKLITLRGALPTIVILAVVTIAVVAVALLTHHTAGGTAWGWAN